MASWLGIGQENVLQIPCSPENEIRVCLLESIARDVLQQGGKIAAIVATMGTTDHFGLDDLKAIHELRDKLVDEFHLDYIPHIHGDAVIGWAWSVFTIMTSTRTRWDFGIELFGLLPEFDAGFANYRSPIPWASIFIKPFHAVRFQSVSRARSGGPRTDYAEAV